MGGLSVGIEVGTGVHKMMRSWWVCNQDEWRWSGWEVPSSPICLSSRFHVWPRRWRFAQVQGCHAQRPQWEWNSLELCGPQPAYQHGSASSMFILEVCSRFLRLGMASCRVVWETWMSSLWSISAWSDTVVLEIVLKNHLFAQETQSLA